MLSLSRAKKPPITVVSSLQKFFHFSPMSILTLICCFNVGSNFLVPTSTNSSDTCIPNISLLSIASSIWTSALFSILMAITFSFSSFTYHSSIHLLSFLTYLSFFLLVAALKIFVSPLPAVPFPVFQTSSFPLLLSRSVYLARASWTALITSTL